MVKLTQIVILSLLPLSVFADESFREFMNDIDKAEQKIDYSENLTPVDGIHNLIPAARKLKKAQAGAKAKGVNNLGAPVPLKPKAENKASGENKITGEDAISGEHKAVVEIKAPVVVKRVTTISNKYSSSVYISPSLRSNGSISTTRTNTVAVTFPKQRNKVHFGIYIGTKIPVETFETASNVQSGFIQLKIKRSIIGSKETLPIGTTFFARPNAVIGSARVYLKVFKGLTPEGKEFRVDGSFVSTEDESFGLIGRIENDGKSLARAGDVATNTLGTGIINAVPGAVGADALKDAGLSLLNDNRQAGRKENGRPVYIVVAEPQTGFIQILETF